MSHIDNPRDITETIFLNDLKDVLITTPADNELLAFDTSSGEWLNQTPAEAGLEGIFLKLDASNDPLTGTLTTENIEAVIGGDKDIGESLNPFNGIYGRTINVAVALQITSGVVVGNLIPFTNSSFVIGDNVTPRRWAAIHLGTSTSTTLGDLSFDVDNKGVVFGAAQDASIKFDGNSLNIVANAVTSTDIVNISSGVTATLPGSSNRTRTEQFLVEGYSHSSDATNSLLSVNQLQSDTNRHLMDVRLLGVQKWSVDQEGDTLQAGSLQFDAGTAVISGTFPSSSYFTFISAKSLGFLFHTTSQDPLKAQVTMGVGGFAEHTVNASRDWDDLTIRRDADGDAGTFSVDGYNLKLERDITNVSSEGGGYLNVDDKVVIDNAGNVGIGVTDPSQALDLIGSLELEDTTTSTTGVIYKGANPFMHNFHHPTGGGAIPSGNNLFFGDAGNFTMGSTATQTFHASDNIGFGMGNLASLTTGYRNVAIGNDTMGSMTTGNSNMALGDNSLTSNQVGLNNTAVGANTLVSSTSNQNTAVGSNSLRSITIGAKNSSLGLFAGRFIADGSTPNETTNNSLYIGAETKASADGADNEVVIGYQAIGGGANTMMLGNTSMASVILPNDSQKLYFGAAQDASITYDNTNLIINPAEVGVGIVRMKNGAIIDNNFFVFADTTFEVAQFGLSNSGGGFGLGHFLLVNVGQASQEVTTTSGNQIVYTEFWSGLRDYDHPTQDDFVAFFQATIDPNISNNAFGLITHNRVDFVIGTGAETGVGTSPLTIRNALVLNPTGGVSIENNYLLPRADGSINDILKTDGAGNTAFATPTSHTQISFSMYDAEPARGSETSLDGAFIKIADNQPLNSVPTDLVVSKGTGKIIVIVNAGSDIAGDITVTGTSVDRDTGATTPSDTDTITVDALTTDNSDTDTNGNDRHAFTGAYITSKWFVGTVTLSTTNLTLTDVDVYHVSFEQFDDTADITLDTFDANLLTTNVNAEFDAYIYAIMVTGDKCNISREASLNVGADGETALADRYWRLRRGNIAKALDGTTDGTWVDVHYANSPAYVEDVSIKVWATEVVPLTLI